MYQLPYSTSRLRSGLERREWDNSPVMAEILALCHELAQLLGFGQAMRQILATKMAKDPAAGARLPHRPGKTRPSAGRRAGPVGSALAKAEFGVDELQPWDIAYYSEKQKQHLYSISDEQLRPISRKQKAVSGLFEVVKRIYGITAKERTDVDVWHPKVRFFELYGRTQRAGAAALSRFRMLREHKRGGRDGRLPARCVNWMVPRRSRSPT